MKARAQTPLAAAGSDALLDHLLDLTLDVALLARRLDRGDVGSRRDDHTAQLVLHDELGALQKEQSQLDSKADGRATAARRDSGRTLLPSASVSYVKVNV